MAPLTTLDPDDAREIACGESFDAYTFLASQKVSEHRWYTKRLIVFEDGDKAPWGFYYLDPATEMQEGGDLFEAKPVPVFRVVGKSVATTVYEPA